MKVAREIRSGVKAGRRLTGLGIAAALAVLSSCSAPIGPTPPDLSTTDSASVDFRSTEPRDANLPLDAARDDFAEAPADLERPDLAARDLVASDLAPTPDLAFARDFAVAPDLAVARDLAIPLDLTVVPDLAADRDFAAPPDLVVAPDFSVAPDLSIARDLSIAPDLAVAPDFAAVPDLAQADMAQPTSCAHGLAFSGPPMLQLPLGRSSEVVLVDVDRDGLVDVVSNDSGSAALKVFRNLGNRSFAAPVAYDAGPAGYKAIMPLAAADLNHDGMVDLAVAVDVGTVNNVSTGWVSVLLNQGNGTFGPRKESPIVTAPKDIAIGDLDGDGSPDIAVVSRLSSTNPDPVTVLHNDGNGAFATVGTFNVDRVAGQVAIVDLDGDKLPEIVTSSSYTAQLSVLKNLGNSSFAAAIDYPTTSNTSSLITADLDGDGRIDLATCGANAYPASTVSVFLGRVGGVLAPRVDYPIAKLCGGLSAADLDGDGKPEIVTPSSILRNLGNGTFASPVLTIPGGDPSSASVADLDGDGRPDLALANTNVSLLYGKGSLDFSTTVEISAGTAPFLVLAPDLNRDGKPDLLVAKRQSPAVSVLLNQGAGAFSSPTNYTPAGSDLQSLAVGDVDGDGLTDVVGTSWRLFVLRNQGGGALATPTFYSTTGTPMAVALGDLDGDGRLDAVTAIAGTCNRDPMATPMYTCFGGGINVHHNAGGGSFAAAVAYDAPGSPLAVAIDDVNADGKADIVVASTYVPTLSVYLNQGGGTFGPRVDFPTDGPWTSGAVHVADFDGDGVRDVLLSNGSGGTVQVLRGSGGGMFSSANTVATRFGLNSLAVAAVGDVDGDGRLDFVTNDAGVYLNRGNLNFVGELYPCSSGAESVSLADFDGDGHLDFATANSSANTVSVLLQRCY